MAQINSRKLDELANIPEPPYLIDGFLRQHTLTLLSSEPHVGKTMFMLDMMLCMEKKLTYLKTFDVVSPSSCLFLGLDSPKWDLASQLRKLAVGHQISGYDLELFDSRAICRRDAKILITDNTFVEYAQYMRQLYGIDVLFIDTLRRVHSHNENDSGEMSYVMEKLESLVDDHGFTVILATHTAKPGLAERSTNYSARGSTVISGSVDFHYHLSLNRDGNVVLNGSAKRRGESKGSGDLIIKMVDLPGPGIVLEPIAPAEQDAEPQILAALAHGKLTAKDLVDKTGIGYWKIQKSLTNLLAKGRIIRPSRGVWELANANNSQ